MGIFGSFSSKSTRDAAATAAKAIETGRLQGTADLDAGYAGAADQIGKATNLFGDLGASYGAGSKLYQDALGVNGGEASAAARGSFTASPGYGFSLDQGLSALQRTRAVNGTLASGGADTDTMKFANGLASQDWGNWLANLANLDTKRMGAVQGEAGTYNTLGQLAYGTGAAKAGLDTSAANGVAQGAYRIADAQAKADANKFQALMGVGDLFGSAVGAMAGNPAALGNIGKNAKSAFSIFGS